MANQWTWTGDHFIGGTLTNVGGISSTGPMNFAGSTLTLSAVATSSGSTAVYTGTITGGANNAYVGASFTVTGFVTVANNGVDLLCSASSATSLTLSNAAAVAETHAASAATAGLVSIAGSMLDGAGHAGASGDLMTSSGPGTLWQHPSTLTVAQSQVTGLPAVLAATPTISAGAGGSGTFNGVTVPETVSLIVPATPVSTQYNVHIYLETAGGAAALHTVTATLTWTSPVGVTVHTETMVATLDVADTVVETYPILAAAGTTVSVVTSYGGGATNDAYTFTARIVQL